MQTLPDSEATPWNKNETANEQQELIIHVRVIQRRHQFSSIWSMLFEFWNEIVTQFSLLTVASMQCTVLLTKLQCKANWLCWLKKGDRQTYYQEPNWCFSHFIKCMVLCFDSPENVDVVSLCRRLLGCYAGCLGHCWGLDWFTSTFSAADGTQTYLLRSISFLPKQEARECPLSFYTTPHNSMAQSKMAPRWLHSAVLRTNTMYSAMQCMSEHSEHSPMSPVTVKKHKLASSKSIATSNTEPSWGKTVTWFCTSWTCELYLVCYVYDLLGAGYSNVTVSNK